MFKNSVKLVLVLVSFAFIISCGGVGKYCSKDDAYCLDFGGGTVAAGPKAVSGWPIGTFPWEYGADASEIYIKLAGGKNASCKQSADKVSLKCEGGAYTTASTTTVTFTLKK